MALWKIEPTFKKSIIERIHLHKDGKTIIEETGWRWGEFTVETEDDDPPGISEGDDLYDCGYDVEMQYCDDGCWTEYEFEGFTEEEEEEMREWLEDNSFFDLEEDGWMSGDTEMIIGCEPEITQIDENGNTIGEPVVNDIEEEFEAPKLNVQAKWPFDNATEPAKFTCESCGYTTEDIMDLDETDDEGKGAYICPECTGKVDLG